MKITRRLAGTLAAAATAGTLLAAGAPPAQAAAPGASGGAATTTQTACCMHRHHLEASLRGSSTYPRVRGHADYTSSWRRQLDVSIWHARRLARHKVTVYVHGTKVGTMTVWRDGEAHMHRHHGVPHW
jgi:hypothetical protein